MKIKDKDFYYGVVLTQIADYPTFTSINKITEKEGLYQINDDKLILIKYSKADNSEWRFTFRKDDFEGLSYEYSIVLVCGGHTVCLLSYEEIVKTIDQNEESQWISVSYPEGGQLRVKGSKGDLPYTVAHNAFPKNLLGVVTKNQELFAWPELSKLNFYAGPPRLIFSSVDRMLDLADNLTIQVIPKEGKTVYFGLSTISHLWDAWTEENLKKIEKHIKYDLQFDGFNVDIERITDVICPQTKKQDIPCYYEFLWKLTISVDCGDTELEVRVATADFPNLVLSKGESICSIEIDVDHLAQEEKYQYGGWENLLKKISAVWVREHSFSGRGTVWGWGSYSVNFENKPSFSMFYVVLGMPKAFRDYLGTQIRVLGKHVRPESDYVIPNSTDGWDVRFHIEKGIVWEKLDPITWQEFE